MSHEERSSTPRLSRRDLMFATGLLVAGESFPIYYLARSWYFHDHPDTTRSLDALPATERLSLDQIRGLGSFLTGRMLDPNARSKYGLDLFDETTLLQSAKESGALVVSRSPRNTRGLQRTQILHHVQQDAKPIVLMSMTDASNDIIAFGSEFQLDEHGDVQNIGESIDPMSAQKQREIVDSLFNKEENDPRPERNHNDMHFHSDSSLWLPMRTAGRAFQGNISATASGSFSYYLERVN